jgi:hypothetical protein
MNATVSDRKKHFLKTLNESGGCGACTYELINGTWTRIGLGNCTCGSCVMTASVVHMMVRELLSPSSIKYPQNPNVPEATNRSMPCSKLVVVNLSDDELLDIVRERLKSGLFWRRVSLFLFITSLLLLGALIYAFVFR